MADRPRGGAFYDDPSVLGEYLTHRNSLVSSPNLVMEEPAVLDEIGEMSGKRILDLGCGDGGFGRKAIEAGCHSYRGIDGSALMVETARRALAATAADVRHGDIEDLADDEQYDLVTSRLALHYVADLRAVLLRIRACLCSDGQFVLSVVHPVITSHAVESDERRTSWTVDRYFDRGPRARNWFGSSVTWHHRTVEDYVSVSLGAGFRLVGLREAEPDESSFDGDREEYERRSRVPLFLVLHLVPDA